MSIIIRKFPSLLYFYAEEDSGYHPFEIEKTTSHPILSEKIVSGKTISCKKNSNSCKKNISK